MTPKKTTLVINLIQVFIGLLIFMFFVFAFFMLGGGDSFSVWQIIKSTAQAACLPTLIYFLNFIVLIPKLLFQDRKMLYVLLNLALVLVAIFLPFFIAELPEGITFEQVLQNRRFVRLLVGIILIRIVLYIGMIALAVGMRYVARWYVEKKKPEAREEERTSAFFRVGGQFMSIEFADILYISAMKDYVSVKLIGKRDPVLIHLTMKAAEQQFPSDRFMRVHRSHIVALEKITSIDPGGNIMLGEVVIPVSESYRKGVEAYLAAHLFKEKEKI